MDENAETPLCRPAGNRSPRGSLFPVLLSAVLSVLILAAVVVAGRPPGPAGAAGGDLGTWASTTSLPEALWAFAATANQQRIYIYGGEKSDGTNVASVRSAVLSPDGAIGSWSDQPSLGSPRIDHGAAIAGGCVYVAGGYGGASETVTNTVEYVSGHGSPALSNWRLTSSMSTPRAHFGLVVRDAASGGYIYAVGGATLGGAPTSTVEFAPINPDCTLGPWQDATPLTSGRAGLRAVVGGGYLFAVGGLGAAGTSVQYASIGPDGALGSWQTTSSLNTARSDMAVFYNRRAGYVYALGGLGSGLALLASIERAPLSSGGMIAGPWSNVGDLPSARENMAFAQTNGRIYLLGGRDPDGVTSTVDFAPLEGAVPSIVGCAIARDGGVANVGVLLWPGSMPSGAPSATSSTGTGNCYEFNALSPGIYTLPASVSAERLDYVSSDRVTVTVEAGKTPYLNLAPKTVKFLGQVRAPNGAPLVRPFQEDAQGARVLLQNATAGGALLDWSTSNSGGYYKHGGLGSGTYTLRAYAPYTGSFSLLAPSAPRTMSSTPGLSYTVNLTLNVPSITGTVMTGSSQPVTRTRVSLWDEKRTIQRSAPSNDNGQFALRGVPQGPAWVEASPPDDGRFSEYAESTPRRVDVVSGTTTYA
ncbi:MAG: carboxypeptidase regulatory-like domain-containing protein, partial [Chloroflexota bacterium]|nr:carboxypeptidase regulatory-like domain-containing protein [Chloroflexota bacterium]